ncbi:uncharacterized protein LOC133307690 [Gastrolobium bilobum]|uniref:uncharacterized protein LOC133307690 n=1 Tax=Gastrolobium bilobum TaxID=150636 RepID=UPI002AB298E5|nr:uncharacterized protein LOC133307690 [Gastrolobium bilobum]
MANTIFTQKATCLAAGSFSGCQASKVDHPIHHLRFNSKIKYNRFSLPEQNTGFRIQNEATRKMNMAVYASIPPEAPFPVDPSPGHWKVWIIGTIFTILLSFSKGKWGPLLQLKEKIDTVIDEAEQIADVVEEVAEGVEKVAEGAVKNIPEGKLHDTAEFVEKIAEDIDKQAKNAEDALEKVEDMEKEFESFLESTTHQEKTIVPTTEAKDQK